MAPERVGLTAETKKPVGIGSISLILKQGRAGRWPIMVLCGTLKHLEVKKVSHFDMYSVALGLVIESSLAYWGKWNSGITFA